MDSPFAPVVSGFDHETTGAKWIAPFFKISPDLFQIQPRQLQEKLEVRHFLESYFRVIFHGKDLKGDQVLSLYNGDRYVFENE